MTAVAVWVAALPGAVGRVAAFGPGALLVCTLGIVLLCLLRTPLRLIGALLVGVAVLMMLRTDQPDVLIAADANAAAVRGRDGRLAILHFGSDTFAPREWLSAEGDARTPKDASLRNGVGCDDAGCIAKLADGSLVAIVRRVEAFEEDCRRAALVISGREAPTDCGTLVIDRRTARASGSLALRRVEGGFEVTPARPNGYDRPWAHNPIRTPVGVPEGGGVPNPPSRDATPSMDDLEAGD